MKILFQILLPFCFIFKCNFNEVNLHKSIPITKDMILIIDVYDEFPNSSDPKEFRDRIEKVIQKINRRYNPSLVFIDNLFNDNKLDTDAFAKSININGNLILPYSLDYSEAYSNQTEEVLIKLKEKFPNQKKYAETGDYLFNKIILPTNPILQNTFAFCGNFYDRSEETEEIKSILAVVSFQEYFLNTCTLVLANEFLKKYQFKIFYDPYSNKFIARSKKKDEYQKTINLSKKSLFQDNYFLEIKFETFPTITNSEFLLEEELIIPENTIIIINTTNFTLKIPKNKSMPSVQVLASQIFSLVHSLNETISK
ncbi:hypothetical protein EHQ59_12715 [Leptospira kemamanensis]|uniref:Uncharacterized protein n=1 Tax=Leptospira kemamanensis TaxID=2484942 RepID=A0A4R9JNZ2_9LEPT|nr:hypothetical protein [Leptospira kemamanensis]TGL50809.1 hypothetical protein EHQ59_12715 [Leptospira kemamanensis]